MSVLVNQGGVWMPLVDPLAKIGGVAAEVKEIQAYHDTDQRTLVWSRDPMLISVSVLAWNEVQVTIAPPGSGADAYRIRRNDVVIYEGILLSFTDKDVVMPGTRYTYEVSAIRGGTVVATASEQITTPDRLDMGLALTATAYNSITATWTDPSGGDVLYRLKRSSTVVYGPGPDKSFVDASGIGASTSYSYTLEAVRSDGTVIPPSDSASVTTPARPVTTKVATLGPTGIGGYAHGHASYNGAGTGVTDYSRRTDTSRLYVGRYSGNRGDQRSLVTYNVPADLRNCIKVTKVEMSIKNDHTYTGTSMTTGVVVHHGYLKDTFPGSTGLVGQASAAEEGWLGGSEWIDITGWKSSGRYTVAEEFRRWGARGLGLVAPTAEQKYYGYFYNSLRIRLTYQVYG